MNYENRVRAAEQLADPIERLAALETIRQELYAGDTYKTDEARRLLGRSELSPEHWGPLTIAICKAEKLLRMPPRRSDWRKRTPTTNSEPSRLLQDARSYIYSDAKFWDRDSRRWDELAHAASIQVDERLKTADLQKREAAQARNASKAPYVSEWIKI